MTFRDTLQPDAPLVQSARFRFDAADRQYIDGQAIACELFLSTCLLNGIHATYGTAASALALGDVVCLSGATTGTVTLANAAALATAGAPLGVVLEAAASGAKVRYALRGSLPPATTGLATGAAGAVRVSTLGRLERVASLGAGDYGVGTVDAAGWLTLGTGEGASAGPVVTSVTGTAPIASSGGTTPAISIAAASGVAAGSMSAAHYTLVNNATATPTASRIAKWGADISLGAAFLYGAGTVATTGFVNVANNVIGAAAADSTGLANLATWKWNGSDILELGDATNGKGVLITCDGALANVVTIALGGVGYDAIRVGLTGIGLFGSPSGATGGDAMLTWSGTSSPPTGAPSGTAIDLWVGSTDGLKARTAKVLDVTLVPVTNSAATDQRLDKLYRSVHTTDDTPTEIARYALPAACCAALKMLVTMQQTGTDATAVYEFTVTGKRAAGGAAVTVGAVTTIIDTIGVAGVPSVAAAGNDMVFSVTGKAGPTDIDSAISCVHLHLFAA